MSESGRLFRGANRAVLPETTDEANRCNLRHVTPKTLQKALYVGFSESGRPLQVVGFGWSRFQGPEARLAGLARPICGLTCLSVCESWGGLSRDGLDQVRGGVGDSPHEGLEG